MKRYKILAFCATLLALSENALAQELSLKCVGVTKEVRIENTSKRRSDKDFILEIHISKSKALFKITDGIPVTKIVTTTPSKYIFQSPPVGADSPFQYIRSEQYIDRETGQYISNHLFVIDKKNNIWVDQSSVAHCDKIIANPRF